MRSVVLLAALLSATSLDTSAQQQLAAWAGDDITVQVVPDERPVASRETSRLDLGVVSAYRAEADRQGTARHVKSFSITRRVRVRVARKDAGIGRVVMSAYLLHDCYPCRLRFDGIELSPNPTVVARNVLLNRTSEHRIEIVVPAEMPAGAVDAEIGWQVDQP